MFKRGLQRWVLFIVIITLLVTLTHQTLRRPIHAADIPATFSRLDSYLAVEDWENAAGAMHEFEGKWNRVKLLILLNAGIDSLLMFESAMVRLEKAIQHEAMLEAQLELAEMRIIWREFITF